MKDLKLPKLSYNWISASGAILITITLIIMTFLYIVDLFASDTNPYLGIFLYMFLPVFLVVGLLLIPFGMYHRWRQIKKTGRTDYPAWPYIDLNIKRHRNASVVFLIGTVFILGSGAIGSYQAYHYSESVTFCGKTCHTVMEPEYTAYQNSPHARVACVACHVGPGADWFAKSKLSGLYQVYATVADKFPRPIPTPIENLRPARETCEQCHWPEKFFGAQQRQYDHFMYDEENTPWSISLLVKTGGGHPNTGQVSGIHWHMFIGKKIEYIPRNRLRQDIPWVRATDLETGLVTVYQDRDKPLTQDILDTAATRTVDCVDCHNRPSHIYNAPDHAIDKAMQAGYEWRDLPEIKRIAVEAMTAKYPSRYEGYRGIDTTMKKFYRDNHPDIYKNNLPAIEAAVAATRRQFAVNIFPDMIVSWEKYPDNLGHFYNVGCMRCHDGNHASADGRIITTGCNSCHVLIAQGKTGEMEYSTASEGLPFKHPEDIDDAWLEMGCFECHTGVQP
ncbi:MAG: cytochrome c3 family protein [Candidatus Zixiibacteriota bacterium]